MDSISLTPRATALAYLGNLNKSGLVLTDLYKHVWIPEYFKERDSEYIPESVLVDLLNYLHTSLNPSDFLLYLMTSANDAALNHLHMLESKSCKVEDILSDVSLSMSNVPNQGVLNFRSTNLAENSQSIDLLLPNSKDSNCVWLEMSFFFQFILLIRHLIKGEWLPQQVNLQATDLRDLSEVLTFQKIDVRYGQPTSSFTIQSSVLERIVPKETFGKSERIKKGESSTQSASFESTARLVIKNYVAQPEFSLDAFSEIINYSPRLIQVQLNKESTSFREILEQERVEFAIKKLQSSRFQISDISAQLGYSQPSAFIRAFKRVTGQSPKQYLKTQG